ncbi:hypothetical protein H5410_051528 [Solanum commersonii]|uniref:Uncharacterized protein n=1 Tax=Solanum commersonii TaxID=4109 RepID=A0A9J5X098_SOLCO|nr:hypothetical protein H5410_051528 [Solanum commersonii]
MELPNFVNKFFVVYKSGLALTSQVVRAKGAAQRKKSLITKVEGRRIQQKLSSHVRNYIFSIISRVKGRNEDIHSSDGEMMASQGTPAENRGDVINDFLPPRSYSRQSLIQYGQRLVQRRTAEVFKSDSNPVRSHFRSFTLIGERITYTP